MPENLTNELMNLFVREKTPTLFDSVSSTMEKVNNDIKDSVVVNDSYGNSLLSVGDDDKVESFTNYGFSNDTLNYPLWLALYNDSWVFRRAIDKPAQDQIRCGITLEGSEDKSKVYKELKKHKFDLIKLCQWGALTGGSVACLMFDSISDDSTYERPLSSHIIKSSKVIRMYTTDRWYGLCPSSETVEDMADIDFGKPKYYTVSFPDGHSIKFHHSYVLRYEHRTAPNLIKNGQLQGWGYAEGSHILNELSRDDKLKASIQSLVDKSLIEIIKMSGMRGVFMSADTQNQDQLRKRLEMVNWGRNFNSLTFLDKEDEYQQNTYSGLGGLSDILQQNMWLVAAALEMQGILFGDLKGGFSNDEKALERYDETINGRCESYLKNIFQKLIRIFYIKYDIDEPVEFTFNSLLMKQQDKDKMESIQSFVQLCTQLMDSGVLTSRKFGESLQRFMKDGIVDFGLDEDYLKELDENLKSESEDFDMDGELSI